MQSVNLFCNDETNLRVTEPQPGIKENGKLAIKYQTEFKRLLNENLAARNRVDHCILSRASAAVF